MCAELGRSGLRARLTLACAMVLLSGVSRPVPLADAVLMLPPAVALHDLIEAQGLLATHGEVKRGQRFSDLVEGYSLSPEAWAQFYLLPRATFDFRKIVEHSRYTLLARPGHPPTLEKLIYEIDPVHYVIFHLDGDSLRVEQRERKVRRVERRISGIIQSTLSETMEQLGMPPQLTNRFADIFAWQMDFRYLQPGDFFELIYEDLQTQGRSIGIGEIKGAYFDHDHRGYCAFPFDQGKGLQYFDCDGNSMEKFLLRYPIEFTRISSRYNLRRLHPVTGAVKPHLGTDFAASMGTPIRSVGDGVVVEAGYKRYNGNYVKIRHGRRHATQYLHMSRIASGIRKGAQVTRGQQIGFVGKTGLATGPHLCYRFWKDGVQIDALRAKLPGAQSIVKKNKPAFEQVKEEILSRLHAIAPARR